MGKFTETMDNFAKAINNINARLQRMESLAAHDPMNPSPTNIDVHPAEIFQMVTTSAPLDEGGEPKQDITLNVDEASSYAYEAMKSEENRQLEMGLEDIGPLNYDYGTGTGGASGGNTSLALAGASYAARSATFSVRGYFALAEQMGLPKDVTMQIKKFEELSMMAMKMVQFMAVAELALSPAAGPMAPFYAFVAGGSLASSMSYGMKFEGSGV